MDFADHFSTIAARYAAYRPRYPAALVDLLAAEAPARHLAWDAGCGTGQLSVDLARRFDQVIATDPSQAQIAAAEPAPRVFYRCEPAEASTLAAASCDLVVAAQAAHWFAWPRFVAEVGRVARPGALAALVSYGVPVFDGDAPLRAYREVIARDWPPGREHVENGYRDLRWPWPAVAAPEMELVEHWTRDELVGYVGTWSATVKRVAAHGTGAVEALAAALPERTYEVRWPLALVLARVSARP
jgi:SAM-dependent methyltransferase